MVSPPSLLANQGLPLLVTPDWLDSEGTGYGFTDWLKEQRDAVEHWIEEAGVVLFRGFQITSPEDFNQTAAAIRPTLQRYVGGDSPRHEVVDKVYTSTEYPAPLEIYLHNELSYAGWSPERVFFCCLLPAQEGGETTIADGRAACRAIPKAIRERFEKKGITYLQHLWDAEGLPRPGKSWQETFETNDRAEAEAYLRTSGMRFQWSEIGLRCEADHAAVLPHPVTGEPVWHNQADQWHRDWESAKDHIPGSPLPDRANDVAPPEGIGNHVRFADGDEIDLEDLRAIRAAVASCEVVFPWQAGDLMAIDNRSAMHGRKPFRGPRRVLVAMA